LVTIDDDFNEGAYVRRLIAAGHMPAPSPELAARRDGGNIADERQAEARRFLADKGLGNRTLGEGAGFKTKDSGTREVFDTGMVRDTREGKGRYDLLPAGALRRVAQLYERGGVKYGDRNWEKGGPFSRFIDSLLRHAFQAAAGQTDEDHLAAVVFNALAVMELQERGREDLDDLPKEANEPDRG
jgi:hypothetical protein